MLLQSLLFFSSNHLKIDISLKAEHEKTGYIMRRLKIIKIIKYKKSWSYHEKA
jgi:hypothetical protein